MYPVDGNRTATGVTSATATPALTLPSGIQAGMLLIGIYRSSGAGAHGWPAPWQELTEDTSDASNDVTSIAYAWSTETLSGDITLSSGNFKGAGIIWRISGAINPSIQIPELSTVNIGTSYSSIDPSTVTPTGGSKDYLFLSVFACDGEPAANTYSLNYINTVFSSSGTSGLPATNSRVGGSSLQKTASAEDPGANAVTNVSVTGTSAWTIAIHPTLNVVRNIIINV